MGLNQYSDYGSGSSTSSSTSWMCQDKWPSYQPRPKSEQLDPKSSSYIDLVMGRCTLEDVMREFRMNGSDSPYVPDEDRIWARHTGELSGMGPAGAYLRQKSWPEPERSPAQRLPRPRTIHQDTCWNPAAAEFTAAATRIPAAEFVTSTPVFDDSPPAPFIPEAKDTITQEQTRVLSSLPDGVLYSLLREMHSARRTKLPQECRFCKNNGERESYYRSHVLKDGAGRVACPVLRAFVCKRCGASGDAAHTIKYCPLSTNEERIKSTAMMRSVRMASGRRRHSLAPPAAAAADCVVFGDAPPSVRRDYNYCGESAPLDPLWAALEQKLLL